MFKLNHGAAGGYARLCLFLAFLLLHVDAVAGRFVLPPPGVDVVGSVRPIIVKPGEFPMDIARRYKLGQNELLAANPQLRRWIPVSEPQGVRVTLPTRYVLPTGERHGVVVNLPEMRLYYYPEGRSESGTATVYSFPVSIGRADWQTPITEAKVVSRRENPFWFPPESIRLEALQRGQVLPSVVPAGPHNPLGRHAIYLDLPGYLIHGTPYTNAVGMRVTHGCLRMYPSDIFHLFVLVPDGTPVRIVHEPVKLGWHAGILYLEVHAPLEELQTTDQMLFVEALKRLDKLRDGVTLSTVVPQLIHKAVREKSGIPVPLYASEERPESALFQR